MRECARLRDNAKRVQVIDSHTGGEPTRVVINGAPDLGNGALRERLERFRTNTTTFVPLWLMSHAVPTRLSARCFVRRSTTRA